jgi:hypothetical protein
MGTIRPSLSTTVKEEVKRNQQIKAKEKEEVVTPRK